MVRFYFSFSSYPSLSLLYAFFPSSLLLPLLLLPLPRDGFETDLSQRNRDMFGGGAMMDMMERSALADAQRQADTARMLVNQARQLQPMIGDLARLDMPQGNIMSDVFLDNIFTDYAFHQKIQA